MPFISQNQKLTAILPMLTRISRLRGPIERECKSFLLEYYKNSVEEDGTSRLASHLVDRNLWNQMLHLFSSVDKAHQAFGIAVPIFLTELFGISAVETNRVACSMKNKQTCVSDDLYIKTGLRRYTKHRLV